MVQTIQLDAFLCVGFFVAQIYMNRMDLWPVLILFLWRGFIVSMYDNAYHYGTDPHDVQAANNLSVPGFLRPVILHHNLHRLHHRYPTASWATLREFEKRDGETFDAPLVKMFFSQLRGPVRRPAKT
jgi:fatty acid desaturase